MAKKRKFVSSCLHILGFALCILPPILCTLSFFPLWQESTKAVSGGVLLLLLFAALPLFKFLKKLFESPAGYLIWLILFLLFFSLSKIAEEMTVISFSGLIGNISGAVCFNIGKRIGGEKNA